MKTFKEFLDESIDDSLDNEQKVMNNIHEKLLKMKYSKDVIAKMFNWLVDNDDNVITTKADWKEALKFAGVNPQDISTVLKEVK